MTEPTSQPDDAGATAAVHAAQRMYQRGERIELQSVAERLDVDVDTVVRWVGDRDDLIVKVLWNLTSGTFARHEALHAESPGPRAAAIVTGAATDFMTNSGHQQFLAREGELALKLLTTRASGYQQRFIGLVRDVVARDDEAGLLRSRVPVEDLPFVLVRMIESYVYFTLITGDEGEVERGTRVIGEILAPQFHH